MDRIAVAFLLIALLVLTMAGGIGLRIYSAPERTQRRRSSKERAARGTDRGSQ